MNVRRLLVLVLVCTISWAGCIRAQDGRLLESQIYDALPHAAPAMRVQIAELALTVFLQQAESLNLQRSGLTQAIMEGHITPHPVDLELISEAIATRAKQTAKVDTVHTAPSGGRYRNVTGPAFERGARRAWIREFGAMPEEYLFLFSIRTRMVSMAMLERATLSGTGRTKISRLRRLAFRIMQARDRSALYALYERFGALPRVDRAVALLVEQDITPLVYFRMRGVGDLSSTYGLRDVRQVAEGDYARLHTNAIATARERARLIAHASEQFEAENTPLMFQPSGQAAVGAAASQASKGFSAIAAFFYSAALSVFFEFGDNLYCAATTSGDNDYDNCIAKSREIQVLMVDNQNTPYLLGSFFGYFITPFAAAMLFAAHKAKSAGQIFWGHLGTEAVEGFVSSLGDYMTFFDVVQSFYTFALALLAGAVRGGLMATLFTAGKVLKFLSRILLFAIIIVVISGFFVRANATPGLAASKALDDVVSTPPRLPDVKPRIKLPEVAPQQAVKQPAKPKLRQETSFGQQIETIQTPASLPPAHQPPPNTVTSGKAIPFETSTPKLEPLPTPSKTTSRPDLAETPPNGSGRPTLSGGSLPPNTGNSPAILATGPGISVTSRATELKGHVGTGAPRPVAIAPPPTPVKPIEIAGRTVPPPANGNVVGNVKSVPAPPPPPKLGLSDAKNREMQTNAAISELKSVAGNAPVVKQREALGAAIRKAEQFAAADAPKLKRRLAPSRTVPRVDTSELISGFPPSRRGAGRYRLGHFDDHAGHGFEARVTRSGELNLSIAANGTRSAEFGSGADMFNSLMRRLDSDGVQVNSIRSEWVPGGKSTNYNQYIDGVNSGLSPSQAAANTWTGQRAAQHGFTNITVNSTDGVVSFSFGRP